MSPFEESRSRFAGKAQAPAGRLLRSVWTPLHAEYLRPARAHSSDPAILLRALLGEGAVVEPTVLPETASRTYGEAWEVDRAALQFLQGLARAVRPERVLETGVADGASTRVLLDVMEANGNGALYSVDVSSDVGALARGAAGASRWHLEVLPARGRARALRAVLTRVQPLDIFLHDSDHSYAWQRFEYGEAWKALAPAGWLLSDDVNSSYAFLDFAKSVGQPFWILSHPRKLFGVVRKGGT